MESMSSSEGRASVPRTFVDDTSTSRLTLTAIGRLANSYITPSRSASTCDSLGVPRAEVSTVVTNAGVDVPDSLVVSSESDTQAASSIVTPSDIAANPFNTSSSPADALAALNSARGAYRTPTEARTSQDGSTPAVTLRNRNTW